MMTVGSLALSTVKLFADQVKHPTTRIRTCHKTLPEAQRTQGIDSLT